MVEVSSHRWIGLLWNNTLQFEGDVVAKLYAASPAFTTLVVLVNGHVLPLTVALELFQIKVDSILSGNRWLWGTSEASLQRLDRFLDRCALCLLGADPWRNAWVIRSELGWHVTGAQLAVVDVACRRARVLALSEGDVYKRAFDKAAEFECGWAHKSRLMIQEHGLQTLPHGAMQGRVMVGTASISRSSLS